MPKGMPLAVGRGGAPAGPGGGTGGTVKQRQEPPGPAVGGNIATMRE
jgi:hypothetical protein